MFAEQVNSNVLYKKEKERKKRKKKEEKIATIAEGGTNREWASVYQRVILTIDIDERFNHGEFVGTSRK